MSLAMHSVYANQYAAGGKNALIDGLLGSTDFRSGAWQGFESEHAEGTISFKENKKIKQLSFRCLQDIKSWIFMPNEIQLSYSIDGKTFVSLESKSFKKEPSTFGQFIESLSFELPNVAVKQLKFKVINRMTCPEGHLGAGEKSWIFLDEIVIED